MNKSVFLGFLGVWLMSPPKSSSPLERNATGACSSASTSPAATPSISPDLKSKGFVDKLLCALESTDDPVQKNDLLSLALINAYEEGWTDRVLNELDNMRKIFLNKN